MQALALPRLLLTDISLKLIYLLTDPHIVPLSWHPHFSPIQTGSLPSIFPWCTIWNNKDKPQNTENPYLYANPLSTCLPLKALKPWSSSFGRVCRIKDYQPAFFSKGQKMVVHDKRETLSATLLVCAAAEAIPC